MSINIPIKSEKKKRDRDTEEPEEVAIPRRRFNIKKIKISSEQNNFYDDKVNVPNIMLMTKEERLTCIANTDNPFGYPQEYWEIYKRERARRNLRGYENLLNVTNTRIFTNGIDQIPGKIIIKNHRNVNCIKSKENYDNSFLDNIEFNNNSYILFASLGMNYARSLEEYIEMRMESDSDYHNEYTNAINSFYMEKFGKSKNQCSYEEKDFLKECEIEQMYTDFYINNVWTIEYNHISSNKNCDIYDCIIAVIKNIAGEYANFIVIAGGFALSMYIFKNYGYHIGFKDIDIFIHSCSPEIKELIIKNFQADFTSKINDNVICFELGSCQIHLERTPIFTKSGFSSIQIIRRHYSCPQEVIAGFDTDCCSTLVNMDSQIWVTERSHYSIRNGYNVFNFERMSPSYEYRNLKYNCRGFGIWIPFMDYFRDNAFFDFYPMDKKRGSTIFLKFLGNLLTEKKIGEKSSEDYMVGKFTYLDNNDIKVIEFKTFNPNEQTINTFHRVFLEDPLLWYPQKPENSDEYLNLNICSNELSEINKLIKIDNIITRNIIRPYNLKKTQNQFASKTCLNVLKFIQEIDKDIIVYGSLPKGVIFGLTGRTLDIQDRENIDKPKLEFMYKLYIQLVKYSSFVMRTMNIDIGINGIKSLFACKYMYYSTDGEGALISYEINLDDPDFHFYDYSNKIVKAICSTEEHEYHLSEGNIKNDGIYIILPPELSNVHYELLHISHYQSYIREMKNLRSGLIYKAKKFFNQEIDKKIKTGEISQEEANKKFKQNSKEIIDNVNIKNPSLGYDEWKTTLKGITNIISFNNAYPIRYFKDEKLHKTDYQFRNGKIYATEYNIVKDKFNLDRCIILEYPAIDNFVPKINN